MTPEDIATVEQPGWSVDTFAAFWSNPDATLVGPVLTEDVVGHWRSGIRVPWTIAR
jgi:hypothetical protein